MTCDFPRSLNKDDQAAVAIAQVKFLAFVEDGYNLFPVFGDISYAPQTARDVRK